MQLTLKECKVRSWQAQDASSLPQYANNRNVSRNLRDSFPYPYTVDNAKQFIEAALQQSPETHFAIEVDEKAVGGIGVRLRDDIERSVAELGYWLGEPFWGRGIASEAVVAITQFAIKEFNLQRIEAGVFEWNPASARVLEKAGYTWEATLRRSAFKAGQVIDRWLYAFGSSPESVGKKQRNSGNGSQLKLNNSRAALPYDSPSPNILVGAKDIW